MENSKIPNFCRSTEDEENKQCLEAATEIEADYLRTMYDLLPISSMNSGSQAAAGMSSQPDTEEQLGQRPDTASLGSHPRRNHHGATYDQIHRLVRKRENDRAYRERVKEEEKLMKWRLGTLGEENGRLQYENESLKMENNLVDQRLQSQSKELSQLKSELDTLKHEYRKQNVLVQTLSDRLVSSSDLQNKNVELAKENWQLKQSKSPELIKLAEENGRLRLENMRLRAQKDALCGKVVREGNGKK